MDFVHMPLDVAAVCLDCRTVSNSKRACHACASTHLMDLAQIVDRPETQSYIGAVSTGPDKELREEHRRSILAREAGR